MITLTIGVDSVSVALIVAIFMAGLGFGNLIGGYAADRLTHQRSLLAFVFVECAIGIFGLYSADILYHQLYLSPIHLTGSSTLIASTFFTLLLVPTTCMGATLPLICKAATSSIILAPRQISLLYGSNILGAAVGALLGGFVCMRLFGFEKTLLIGALVNFITAFLGFLIQRGGIIPEPNALSAQAPAQEETIQQGYWRTIYLVSGFINLGLEMIWFRVLGVLLKANSFTLSYLLFLYLLGLGIGSCAAPFIMRSIAAPGRWFLRLQLFSLMYAAVSLIVLCALLGSSHSLGNVQAYLAGYEHLLFYENLRSPSRVFIALYGVIAPLLIVVPTALIGASFICIQAQCQHSLSALASTLGSLQSFNIIGATLGSLIIGLFAFDILGTAGSIVLLVLVSLIYLCMLLREGGTSRELLPYFVISIAIVAAFPSNSLFLSRLHGSHDELRLIAEDSTGTAALKPDGNTHHVFTNGLGQSWIPFGSIHSSLGLLPLFVHPHPERVAIVGLGSGDTLYSAVGRQSIRSAVCYEIIRPLEIILPGLKGYHAIERLFSDPRIAIRYGDGRSELVKEEALFDIIEADALRPSSAFSGNLYSREYFELLRSKLAPGGIAVSWIPTERTLRTFNSVFKHTLLFPYIALGSEEEIPFDEKTVLERASEDFALRHYADAGINHRAIISELSPRLVRLGQDLRPNLDVNSDLFPKDEFFVADHSSITN